MESTLQATCEVSMLIILTSPLADLMNQYRVSENKNILLH